MRPGRCSWPKELGEHDQGAKRQALPRGEAAVALRAGRAPLAAVLVRVLKAGLVQLWKVRTAGEGVRQGFEPPPSDADGESGEGMAADQRENGELDRRGLRRAIAVAAFLNFLAVIISSDAALTTTENNPAPGVVNRTKPEVVSVGGSFQNLAVEVTRCRSTSELTWGQFWAIFVPWGLLHILG